MKILFIGGNGNISWQCVRKAIDQGHEVWVLHRGATSRTRREIPPEAKIIVVDFRNWIETTKVLFGQSFDTVIDFICYNAEQARFDVACFSGGTDHFIFISTGSVYERTKRSSFTPYREDSPRYSLREYAKDKIEAEDVFLDAYRKQGFPVTIVRPGYTYDTIVPVSCGMNDWTVPQRILDGKLPIVLGDGSNIYTFTHSWDFAQYLITLCERTAGKGEAYNITSDERRTWEDATNILIDALAPRALAPRHYPCHLHILTEDVCEYLREIPPRVVMDKGSFTPSLSHSLSHMASDFQTQKMWCDLYDNTKIKALCGMFPTTTLEDGLDATIAWLNENPERKRVDPELNKVLDGLTERWLR
jgi:nucleoside-diphosphate-sugar epimerase